MRWLIVSILAIIFPFIAAGDGTETEVLQAAEAAWVSIDGIYYPAQLADPTTGEISFAVDQERFVEREPEPNSLYPPSRGYVAFAAVAREGMGIAKAWLVARVQCVGVGSCPNAPLLVAAALDPSHFELQDLLSSNTPTVDTPIELFSIDGENERYRVYDVTAGVRVEGTSVQALLEFRVDGRFTTFSPGGPEQGRYLVGGTVVSGTAPRLILEWSPVIVKGEDPVSFGAIKALY